MEKDNDIFEQPSKVQNMNFLFDEDEAASSSEPRRPRSASGKNGSGKRPASAQPRQRSAQNGQMRRTRPSQSSSAPAARSTQDRVQKLVSEETTTLNQEASSGLQSEFATPYKPSSAKPARRVSDSGRQQARRPQQAQPRRVRPDDAQPRQARPKQAQPRQAQPRQVRPANAAAPSRTRDYDDNRRVNRSSAPVSNASRGKKKGKKKSSGFKKFLLIYSAILLVILIVGMIIFGSFLKSLENSQPSNIASDAAANLTADKAASYLQSNSDKISCFGEPTDLINQFATNMQGKSQVSYIENKDYRADAPSYNITADGTTVAKITLEKAGSGSFGLSKWAISSIDIADYMDTQSFEFLAPLGTKITINDVELDDKFLTGEESIPENLKIASKYVTIPSYLTYKVAGIAGSPNIVAKDATGKDMALTATADKYVAGSATSQEFIDSVNPIVEGALDSWARHFINMGDNLSAYMIEGSDWYTYIFGGPDMDPILTSLYEFESIANYEFTEKSIGNYIKYTDDCFTVDVKYKMKIDFTTDQMSDNNQQLDATWVFITQNNGNDWYLVDCIYK